MQFGTPKLDHVRALDSKTRHKYTRDADGQTVTIYYSLKPKLDSWRAEEEGHHHISEENPEEAATLKSLRQTMGWLEGHFHMRFTEVNDLDKLPPDAPQPPNRWAIIAASDLSKHKNPESERGTAAYANYPSKGIVSLVFGPKYHEDNVPHEIGHALGLKHPHSKKWRTRYKLSGELDNNINTVMSYQSANGKLHPDSGHTRTYCNEVSGFRPFDYEALAALYAVKPGAIENSIFVSKNHANDDLITRNYTEFDASSVTHFGDIVLDCNPGADRWMEGERKYHLSHDAKITKVYGAPYATNRFIGHGGNIYLPTGYIHGEAIENHFVGGARENIFFVGTGKTIAEGGPATNHYYAGQGSATFIVSPEKPRRDTLWGKRDEFHFNCESGDCVIRGLDTDNGHKIILGFPEDALAAVRDAVLHFEHDVPVLTFHGKGEGKACTIRFEDFKGRISELCIEKCRPKDGMIHKYCRWKDMRIKPRIVGEIPSQFQGEPRYMPRSEEYSLLEKTKPDPEAPAEVTMGYANRQTLILRLRDLAQAVGLPHAQNIYKRMDERLDIFMTRNLFLETASERGATPSEMKALASMYDYAWHHPMPVDRADKVRRRQNEQAHEERNTR